MLAGGVGFVPGLDLDFDTRQGFLCSGCLLCMSRRWDCFRSGVPVSFSFSLIHHYQAAGYSGELRLSEGNPAQGALLICFRPRLKVFRRSLGTGSWGAAAPDYVYAAGPGFLGNTSTSHSTSTATCLQSGMPASSSMKSPQVTLSPSRPSAVL